MPLPPQNYRWNWNLFLSLSTYIIWYCQMFSAQPGAKWCDILLKLLHGWSFRDPFQRCTHSTQLIEGYKARYLMNSYMQSCHHVLSLIAWVALQEPSKIRHWIFTILLSQINVQDYYPPHPNPWGIWNASPLFTEENNALYIKITMMSSKISPWISINCDSL